MMEKKFVECLTKFQLTDLLGFGKMLNVEENDDFIEYISNIVAAALEKPYMERRKLLRLAKDIAAGNEDIKKQMKKK